MWSSSYGMTADINQKKEGEEGEWEKGNHLSEHTMQIPQIFVSSTFLLVSDTRLSSLI